MTKALLLVKSGSTRLPNKNILAFHGKQMFLHNVKKCLGIFDKVYVSSDSDEILDKAKFLGAIPIKRPIELCGNTPNIPCYLHAYKQMDSPKIIVAVQANSPTIKASIIALCKKIMELNHIQELMTCHKDYSIYGSVWAMTRERLLNYGDPYKPHPDILVEDPSIDIHDKKDFNKALKQI